MAMCLRLTDEISSRKVLSFDRTLAKIPDPSLAIHVTEGDRRMEICEAADTNQSGLRNIQFQTS